VKLPFYIFNPRHGMTLRDRVAKLCEYSLRKKLPGLRVTVPSTRQNYIYRSMASADSLPMGVYSLASLARWSEAVPRIQLCVDESLDAAEVVSTFARHGLTVEVATADSLDAELAKRGEETLRRFAQAFFWGRKMAFTFGLGDSVPVLYADLDVLWFKDPWGAFELPKLRGVLAGTDHYHSFDAGMLELMSGPHRQVLLETDPPCAGLYAVGANFQIPEEITGYIATQLAAGTPGYFCEQTLLALTVKLAGKQLSHAELPTCPEEETVWRPSYEGKRWIAAHYAGPTRPQFWRDAWSLFSDRGAAAQGRGSSVFRKPVLRETAGKGKLNL
jgi:hypothetical protein